MLPPVRRGNRANSPSNSPGPASLAHPEAEPSDFAGHETDAAKEIGARRDGRDVVFGRKVSGRRFVLSRRPDDVGERVLGRRLVSDEDRLGGSRRQSSAGLLLSAESGGQ